MLILCPIIATIVHYITALYLLNHIPNICTSKNLSWRCLNAEGTYTVSVIWGVVGNEKKVCFLLFLIVTFSRCCETFWSRFTILLITFLFCYWSIFTCNKLVFMSEVSKYKMVNISSFSCYSIVDN
jgi:hypothetical protein